MADNFNLRSFLTENKLTKNAQLLKEQEEALIQGLNLIVLDDNEGGEITLEKYSDMDEEFQQIFNDGLEEGEWEATSLEQGLAELDEYFKERGDPTQQEAYDTAKQQFQSAVQGKQGKFYVHGIEYDLQLMFIESPSQERGEEIEEGADDKGKMARTHVVYSASVTLGDENGRQYVQHIRASVRKGEDAQQRAAQLIQKHFEDEAENGKFIKINSIGKALNPERSNIKEPQITEKKNTMMKEASYKVSKNSKQAQHLKKGDIITSGDEIVSVSAGAKTPAGKVEVTMKTKSGSTKTSTWGKTTTIGVKPKETVKENTMTNRERRLVEMVNNAMGFSQGEENVDYTMGRQDDPNQLANPAPELNIPEGDESIEEAKPLPKYNSIEELMKEIEHGTNEAACKYKMEEMKRIYEALEAKVGSLEEGENAEHIDQKKVKQMRKDIAALRKAEERLRKDFDKKFNKEKKEAPKKEKEVVALQEGSFDLRKFLVENKMTRNSKMIKENQQVVETFTFGYDLENTQKVQDYLVASYKTSSNQPDILGKEDDANPDCEIIFEYGGDTIGAVDIFNPAILQDRKFMSLVNACEGKGDFEEGDEEYDDDEF